MPYVSHRKQYQDRFEGQMQGRITNACRFLTGVIKADISQPGTLRYRSRGKNGRFGKSKTVYNFTHSRPGNPPYKQTGNLRMSIAYEVVGLVGRVGSNIKKPAYPLYLELGTRKMAARPYLRRALILHRLTLMQMIGRPLPDTVPRIVSNQYRPGHFGRGAARAGWA